VGRWLAIDPETCELIVSYLDETRGALAAVGVELRDDAYLFSNVDANKIAVGGDSAGGNMTCVIALKLRDENGPELALHVPLFPEAAFPGDTLSGSENRTGLYLETNGIYEMVRNYIKNSDDGRHPYITP
jgi:acetyl esterase/lipase